MTAAPVEIQSWAPTWFGTEFLTYVVWAGSPRAHLRGQLHRREQNDIDRFLAMARSSIDCVLLGHRKEMSPALHARHQWCDELGFDSALLSLTQPTVRIHSQDRITEFDSAISTLPLSILARLAPKAIADTLPSPELRYQGVVNVVVVSRKRIQPFYWSAVIDPSFSFQGIVETTHVIPMEWTEQRHLAYLMNYCRADSTVCSTPDDVLIRQASQGLSSLSISEFPADRRRGQLRVPCRPCGTRLDVGISATTPGTPSRK